MKSNFSFKLPSHSSSAMGIKFCRKSPAVGSMKRQRPSADLTWTPVKARVAVLSKGLACAAAEGWRTPPARDTDTGEVGFAVSVMSVT